jgi:hypothetical protein
VWRRPRPVVAILVVIALVVALVVWAPWIAPATVTQVRGMSPTATSAVLQWARSSGHTGPSRYLILRDGTEVGSVSGSQTAYTDSGLRPGHSYSYSVVARSWLRRSAPAPAVTVRALAPSPTRLAADRATANSARLRWSAPADSPAPDRYEIHRDGAVVNTIAGTATSYLDAGLSPATSYHYQIVALWDTDESDPSATLAVKTVTPPLSSARLEGASFPVTLTIVANTTVEEWRAGLRWSDSWDFTPRCPTGPCAVELSGRVADPGFKIKTFRMTLARHGAVYSGTTSAQITYCTTIPVTNTLTLQITVKKAGPEGTEWRALSWAGTLTMRSPFTDAGARYCPGGIVKTAVSGHK